MALTTTEEAQVRQLIDQNAALLSLASNEPTIISKLAAAKISIADLTAASALNDADLFLLRQGTQEKSLTGTLLKAYAATVVPDATETVKGIVELATSAEILSGTDTVRAATAATLLSGLLGDGGNATNDYIKIPFRDKTTGVRRNLVVQWGNNSTGNIVSFPITFPNACFTVIACDDVGLTATAAGTDTITTSSFRMSVGGRFLAIGY